MSGYQKNKTIYFNKNTHKYSYLETVSITNR